MMITMTMMMTTDLGSGVLHVSIARGHPQQLRLSPGEELLKVGHGTSEQHRQLDTQLKHLKFCIRRNDTGEKGTEQEEGMYNRWTNWHLRQQCPLLKGERLLTKPLLHHICHTQANLHIGCKMYTFLVTHIKESYRRENVRIFFNNTSATSPSFSFSLIKSAVLLMLCETR